LASSFGIEATARWTNSNLKLERELRDA
jgi:hypothetical protein